MTLSAFVHRAIEAHPSMGRDELMSRLRAAKSGDRDAFDKVVLSCSRLVYNCVLRTKAWHIFDDLWQEGMIALSEAVEGCEPVEAFLSYAGILINGRLLNYLRRARTVRVPYTARPEYQSVALLSLDDAIDEDEGRGWHELFASDELLADEYCMEQDDLRTMLGFLGQLPEEEREAVRSLWGLGGGAALSREQVLRKQGVSAATLSRRARIGVDRMRNLRDGLPLGAVTETERRHRQATREYQAAIPKEARRAYMRAYYLANREKIIARKKASDEAKGARKAQAREETFHSPAIAED